jgi:hypothetical protein
VAARAARGARAIQGGRSSRDRPGPASEGRGGRLASPGCCRPPFRPASWGPSKLAAGKRAATERQRHAELRRTAPRCAARRHRQEGGLGQANWSGAASQGTSLSCSSLTSPGLGSGGRGAPGAGRGRAWRGVAGRVGSGQGRWRKRRAQISDQPGPAGAAGQSVPRQSAGAARGGLPTEAQAGRPAGVGGRAGWPRAGARV